MADEADKLTALDVIAAAIVAGLMYVWIRLASKAAEEAAPTLVRLVRPTVRSVIERAEQLTREAASEGGSS